MMKTKLWCTVVLLVACLAALPVWAQTNFPAKNDDHAQSFGAFWILIDPPYQPLFAGCPGYDPGTHVLQSPWLYEPDTLIGRSDPLNEGKPQDTAGVKVGSANTIVKDSDMKEPPGFTPPAANAREVHTEIRHLNMVGSGAAVRAGVCYSHAGCSPASPPPPHRISPGEVITNGGPKDFPARSFFNVFAQIDIPHCGGFPATTVFNSKPLFVQTPSISSFPPSGAVYMHDSSSAVAVKFLAAGHEGNVKWERNDRLGCVILAGHGIIPSFGRAELQQTPSAVPVALQKPNVEEQMRRPNREEEERKFRAHMEGEHQKEGGKHKDCGPKEKDDDDDDHGRGHEGKEH